MYVSVYMHGLFHRNILVVPITRVNISWFKNFLGAFYKYIKINICILGLLKNLICNLLLFSSIKYMVVIDIIIFEEE